MRYCSLGSGSRGNCTILSHNGNSLLVDCGFSRKLTVERLATAGEDPVSLTGVLVTHEHSDHAKGVQSLCEALDVPFYASHGTARKMGWLEHELWQVIRSDELVTIEDFDIMPVVVPHDALEPLQFVIRAGGWQVGVLSDLGSLTAHVLTRYQGCHGLQLEANHDPVMLQNGPYPPSLRARVAGDFGHLSNQQCLEFIQRLGWSELQSITAGHISEKNNDRSLVQQMLAPVIGCEPRSVKLLEQDQISPWVEFS